MSPKERLARAIESNAAKIDRFFAGLFLVQWTSRIALAYLRPTHGDDLFTATFVGAFIASVPTMLVVWKPGLAATRHAIAVAQMLYGALLVHLTDGVHATQVHVLFSLALLALYRDAGVIVTGAAVGVLQAFALEEPRVAAEWTMWTAALGAVSFYAARRSRADLADVEKMRAELPKLEVAAPVATKRLIEPASRRLDCEILLVEDDLDNQKILTDHLVRSGVSVAIAPNGQIALAEVSSASERGKPFDLVLMDMKMPVMDGYAATSELRRRGYGGPILALTARTKAGARRRCLDAGCTDYLTKPITRERLLQAVANHALGSAATLPPPPPAVSEEPIYSEHEDSPEMHELLDGFVTRLRQNADEAEAAHASGRVEELASIAHRLRGAAGSFGFMSITEAAERLEEAVLSGGETSAPLAALVSLCRRARTRTLAQAA